MKAALYARVSTDDKGQNPETQLLQLRAYLARTGWELYNVYIDEARAKDYKHRTAWRELQRAARQRLFNVVIVFRLDRAFRTVRECCNEIAEWDALGIKFVATSQQIDTTTPQGMFFVHMLAAVAELESSMISDRVTAGMARAKSEGKRIGRKPLAITSQTICEALAGCNGSRSTAAKLLGCSVPYIYKVLGPIKPPGKPSQKVSQKVSVENTEKEVFTNEVFCEAP
jgi:DNA invertase Pin-like site-specific DNA recombinase